MNIKEKKEGEVLVCAINGEINIDTAPDLRKEFENIAGRDIKKVVLNFSEVTYIDSSGLATLIEMLQRMKKIGGSMRLSNISEKIKSIFEITKLEKLFQMYPDEAQALEGF